MPELTISAAPSAETIRPLLERSGLPTADLSDGPLAHFFTCGPETAPTGVVGLEIHGRSALLRSLAVAEDARGQGYGQALVAEAERHARALGVRDIYLLTTTADPFFRKLGYAPLPREAAPDAIRETREFAELCPASSSLMRKELSRHTEV